MKREIFLFIPIIPTKNCFSHFRVYSNSDCSQRAKYANASFCSIFHYFLL